MPGDTDMAVKKRKRAKRDSAGKPELRYALCFPNALRALAADCTFGGTKYDPYNFKLGQPVSQCMDALLRHASALWNGEDLMPDALERGHEVPHVAGIIWNAMQMAEALAAGGELDDRPHRVLAKRNGKRGISRAASVSKGRARGKDKRR